MSHSSRFLTRLSLAVAALALGLVTATSAGAAATGSPSNPDQADGPGIITIEQLNMCMWGSTMTPDCFPNDSGAAQDSAAWTAEEQRIAGLKRDAIVAQVERHIPDVITVDEGCLNDLTAVASQIGYELATQTTGGATTPRQCTAGRGVAVNAVLAKDITGTGPQGYFESGGHRSYICAKVTTDEWSSVQVCNAHLSLKTQEPHQTTECNILRDDILDPSPGPTLFAGDVNMSLAGENCAPDRYHGLKDLERTAADQQANKTDGLQQIYYSAGFWRESCGWAYTVEHTDHKGFLLELGKTDPGQLDECWRNIR